MYNKQTDSILLCFGCDSKKTFSPMNHLFKWLPLLYSPYPNLYTNLKSDPTIQLKLFSTLSLKHRLHQNIYESLRKGLSQSDATVQFISVCSYSGFVSYILAILSHIYSITVKYFPQTFYNCKPLLMMPPLPDITLV